MKKHPIPAILLAILALSLAGCAIGPQKNPRAFINALCDAALWPTFNGPVDVILPAPLSATLQGVGVHRDQASGEWVADWIRAVALNGTVIELGTKPSGAPLPPIPISPTSTTTSTPATIQQTTTVIPASR